MRVTNYFNALFILSLSFFVGCQEKEDVVPGTGEGKMGMAFVLGSGSNSQSNAKIANNNLEMVEGFIQINELEMELKGRDENGQFEKEHEGDFDEIKKVIFNKFDESSDFFFHIPEAEYKEIEMELDLIENRNEPSIYLDARHQGQGGGIIPVIFEYFGDDIDFEVEIESDNDEYFIVDRVNNPLALLEIHTDRWFRDVKNEELDNATIEDDGSIRINRNSNKAIYSKIVNSIKASSEIEIELRWTANLKS